jgi:hypothetical protein
MAVPAGTQQTYQQVGIREDLSDFIYNIDPVETPFMSMVRKGSKPKNYKVEWQTDSLAAADGTNATIDGDDPAANTASPTVRQGTYTQLMDKVVRVSDRANQMTTAGRKRELAYQVAKRGKELKRDMETRLTGNYASVVGSAATASETAGVEAWLETNVTRGSGGADGGWSSTNQLTAAATDASSSNLITFTEARLKTQIRNIWDAGGNPKYILTGGFNKQVASGFSGIATLYRDTAGQMKSPATILGAADIYISDFGEHKIVPDRFSRDRTALILDMSYWSIHYLMPFNVTPLSKTGHSERRLLRVDFALCSKNEAASGAVADLTTS